MARITGTIQLDAGSVEDQHISSGTRIDADKQQHLYRASTNFDLAIGATPVAREEIVYVCEVAGTIRQFAALCNDTGTAASVTFDLKKNVADLPTWILDYENAVNNAAITIRGLSIPRYCAKLSNVRVGDLKIEGDYQYFEFSYSLEVRREQWIPLKVLDQGFRIKDPTNSENRIHIMDDSKPRRPVVSQRLLNGEGAILADPTPERAEYIDFTVYYARNFSILPGVT